MLGEAVHPVRAAGAVSAAAQQPLQRVLEVRRQGKVLLSSSRGPWAGPGGAGPWAAPGAAPGPHCSSSLSWARSCLKWFIESASLSVRYNGSRFCRTVLVFSTKLYLTFRPALPLGPPYLAVLFSSRSVRKAFSVAQC